MAAQFWVPGPSYVQVGTGASGALAHLGWSESGISVEFNSEFEDVMCDLGGQKIGTDQIYHGQDATITADIVRYDEAVMNALLARIQGGTTGAVGAGQIGSLMIGQALTQRLLIVCPYSTQTSYTGMTAAYNFLNTYLVGVSKVELGSKVKKYRAVWRAVPSWTVSGGLGSTVLFNNLTTGQASVT
jgi:hypothetical protein